jgi:omega-hydroxy-beta-dihydromenaquinone-9 sulfotransferase
MHRLPVQVPFAPVILLLVMVFKNGGASFSRVPLLLVYMLRFLLLEPFRLVELLVYHKKIKSHVLSKPPIFILGYWRSGTSFLQGLLCQDPTTTSSTIFRSLFPDNFYLTESWLKPVLISICKLFRLPYAIQRTQLDLDLNAEADMALCSLSSERSYTWGQLFPKRFHQWVEDLILLNDERAAEEWLQDYDYFIRKLSFRSKGKRVVVKSPGDTGRVRYLLKRYPDATFIYIHRDPIAVFHSNLFFWKVLLQQNSLQNISDAAVQNLVVQSYKTIVQNYLTQRDLVPESQRLEVHYEEIVKYPVQALTKVYAALKLGTVPEKEIIAFLKNNQHFKPGSYSGTGAVSDLLQKEWSFAFEQWQR